MLRMCLHPPRRRRRSPPAAAVSLALGMAILSGPTLAGDDDGTVVEREIEQIVVVAHKHEQSIREVAANITVMNRADLEAQLATSVADVFRYVPGIDHEAAGTRFGTEGINIRGIGGNRVALLVDGVPLGDHFAVGSFSNATRDFVNAGLIERLEVLHGPASALYGSAAIGGVVALRTPDPVDLAKNGNTGGEFLTTWRGADQSLHGTAMLAVGDSPRGFLAGASWRDGQQLHSAAVTHVLDRRDYQRKSALLKIVADDPAGRTWRGGLIHQQSDSRSELHSMLGSGRFRSTTRLEGEDEYALDLLNLACEFGAPENRLGAGILRGYYEIAAVDQDTFDERGLAPTPVSIDRFFHFEQKIRGIELNLQKQVAGHKISQYLGAGLEFRARRTEEYRDGLEHDLTTGVTSNVILGETFPLRDFPLSDTRELGAYFEDVASFGQWSVIAALRADHYELSPVTDPIYAEDYPFAEPVSLSESDISPKLGLIYHLTPSTDVYFQYAHGFRAPPYADANIGLDMPLFNYRAIPNPDLRSESSDGFDLGLRWEGAHSSLRLAVFHTRYADFIESKVRIGTDPVSGRILFQSQNLDETSIKGLEADGRVHLPGSFRSFALDGSIYIARGENRENGQPLNSVGPAQAVFGVSWSAANRDRKLRLQVTSTEAWSNRDESGGELFKPAGFTVVDLYATQKLSRRVLLRAGLLNLADRIYWNWSDVRGLTPDDPVLPYLAQAGRSFAISLNMNW